MPGTLFFQDFDPPEAASEAKPKVLPGTLFFQDFDPPEATSEAEPWVLCPNPGLGPGILARHPGQGQCQGMGYLPFVGPYWALLALCGP